MANKSKKSQKLSQGFTLIEICVVLIIIGILMSYSFSFMSVQMKEKNYDKTQKNIEKIEDALSVHLKMNGYYPCPAEFGESQDNPKLGRASEECKSQELVSSETTLSNIIKVNGHDDKAVRIGLLPYRSLGLSSEAGQDGWNRPFIYAVTESLTDKETFDQFSGAIDVVDENGQSKLKPEGSVQYVILSGGENVKGLFSNKFSIAENCPKNLIESENCDGDHVFVNSEIRYQASQDKQTSQVTFDDIIFYKSYDLDLSSGAGLLYFYVDECPHGFNQINADKQSVVGVEVLQNKIELMLPETIQRGDVRKLCFSTNYSNVFKYNITLKPENNICPDGWANIGYNIFGEKDIDLVLMVCAR
jgi:prepilin-type N-terminal cleavage/methylation domain-containing protein